jgi:hypothetical protein
MQKFDAGDAETIKQAWQRYYFIGRHPDGTEAKGHLNKLRLKEPIDRRQKPPFTVAPAWRATVELGSDAGFALPKWSADSPLNAIGRERTERNERGTRRIDPEGRIADWRGVRVVRQSDDADFCDFVVVDNLLRNAECESLCRAFRELSDRVFSSDDIDPYWNDRFVWFADIAAARPADGAIMIGAQHRAIDLMRQFYQITSPLYADLLQIVTWRTGMFMPPHADNRNPDGSHHHMSHRDFSGVVYLNDDYEGGELYFTALDVAIKPKRGMFVGMTGGFHHEHAVLRVHSGTRLTMPFFLTFNSEYADRGLIQYAEATQQLPSLSLESSG